jgi:hypothetical protein
MAGVSDPFGCAADTERPSADRHDCQHHIVTPARRDARWLAVPFVIDGMRAT